LIKTALTGECNYDVDKLRHLKILLVEDNLLNVKMASILFNQLGMKLQTAENGMEGIKKIKAKHFDLVLMDLEMPVMNGYQAITIIRQELKNNIPIIALTAHNLTGKREKYLQLGMNDYISKPIDAGQLFSMIYKLTCSNNFADAKLKGFEKTETPVAIKENICNLTYLFDVARGNKKVVIEIIDIFLEETTVELSTLRNAIKKTNYSLISDIAHKLRSSFLLLGINTLVPVFTEMEQLGIIASGIDKIKLMNLRINKVFNQAKEEMNLV